MSLNTEGSWYHGRAVCNTKSGKVCVSMEVPTLHMQQFNNEARIGLPTHHCLYVELSTWDIIENRGGQGTFGGPAFMDLNLNVDRKAWVHARRLPPVDRIIHVCEICAADAGRKASAPPQHPRLRAQSCLTYPCTAKPSPNPSLQVHTYTLGGACYVLLHLLWCYSQ